MANVKISELPVLTEIPASDDRLVVYDNSTATVKTVGASYLDQAGNFTKYSVGTADSPYTIPSWDSVIEVHNDTAPITLILPTVTTEDIGKEIKVWLEHNPANHKVEIHAPSTTEEINNVTSDGAEVAKASFTDNSPNFSRVTAQALGTNEIYIDDATSVYNALGYKSNFTSTSSFSPFTHLTLSSVPTDFLTRNNDWWFAVKFESAPQNTSDIHALFAGTGFGVGYYGNGSYLATSGTSGYLQSLTGSPVFIEPGEWVVYQYDVSADRYTAWINTSKVLNATSSGVLPPTTPPTEIIFGSEAPSDARWTAPSGYLYPLRDTSISKLCIGTGNIADSDAALFTAAETDPNTNITLSQGALAHQWSAAAAGWDTDLGAINLTDEGDDISYAQL